VAFGSVLQVLVIANIPSPQIFFHPDDGGDMFLENVFHKEPHSVTSQMTAFFKLCVAISAPECMSKNSKQTVSNCYSSNRNLIY
jgi:hypothetical protein